jgi:hypothetical protein
MCILCVEIAKGKMTVAEAGRALDEMIIPEEHEDEVHQLIADMYTDQELFEYYLGSDLAVWPHDAIDYGDIFYRSSTDV